MNYKSTGRIVGMILLLEAFFMNLPLFVSIYYKEWDICRDFVYTIFLLIILGGTLVFFSRNAKGGFYSREGFIATGLSWIFMSLFGALPFWLSGQIPHYIDAVFETVSGFTTTGASILTDVEALSKGLLFWRSFTHWLGGMGMLVLLLAVLPIVSKNNGSTIYLMRSESPGPSVGKFTPKLHHTAVILYAIYFFMTLLCVLFLLAGQMPLFDSLCTAFGTAGTGGFGVKNDSMMSYSPYLQTVVTVFMFLFGVNFNIYVLVLLRRFNDAFKDEELRLYCGVTVIAILAIAVNIAHFFSSFWQTLHHSAFQVVSIMTTTGFVTQDFDQWPVFSKTIILILMCLGACAGSTGGGIKMVRVLMLFKGLRRNISQVLHPRRQQPVRLNGRIVNESVLHGVDAYLVAYCILILGSITLVSLDNFSNTTNLSAVLSCFNNIGPGLEVVGAVRNYSYFGDFSKLVLTLDMLLGRLEIFPLLVLLNRSAWNRNR